MNHHGALVPCYHAELTDDSAPAGQTEFRYLSLGIVALLALQIYRAAPSMPLVNLVLAGTVFVLGLIPGLVFLKQGMQEDLPLLALHGLFYSVAFGLVALMNSNAWFRPNDAFMARALGWTTAGLIALYAGYLVAGRTWFRDVTPLRVAADPSYDQMRLVAWLFVAIDMVTIYLFPVIREIPSVGQLTGLLGGAGTALLLVLFFEERMARSDKLMLSAYLAWQLIAGIAASTLAYAGTLFLIIAVCFTYVKRRVPIALFIVAIVFYGIFQPVKGEFRAQTWAGAKRDAGILEKAWLFGSLALENLQGRGDSEFEAIGAARMDHVGLFAAAIQRTPARIPYQWGWTYLPLLTKWIPRIVWPEKPKEISGNQWGRIYGLLAPKDFNTSLNLPWLIELYINFGGAGVLLGMFLFGVMFRYLALKLCTTLPGPLEFSIAVALCLRLAIAESNFTLMTGNLLYGSLSLIILSRVILALTDRGPAAG